MDEIVPPAGNDERQLSLPFDPEEAGQMLNTLAARRAFEDYRSRKAAHTLRRHEADLASFAAFLLDTGLRRLPDENGFAEPGTLGDLARDPLAWRHITHGTLQAFRDWMLRQGFAIGTINVRLSTAKKYARLAIQAGAIPQNEWLGLQGVKGYSPAEAERIDVLREQAGLETRRSERTYIRTSGSPGRQIELTAPTQKKAEPVHISDEQASQLKNFPDNTPLGRRDNLLMCLLLDHGLRAGEIARLRAEKLDLQAGTLRFKRPKVHKEQLHRLTADSLRAARRLVESDELPVRGPLLRRVENNGEPGERGLTPAGVSYRVGELGRLVGLEGLSAHDCRHFWATLAAESGTDLLALQEAGGWNDLEMPRRYIEQQEIANQRVKLDRRSGRGYGLDVEWQDLEETN